MAALLMFQASLTEAVTSEGFERWYEREHFAERRSLAGVLASARYRSVIGPYQYLAVYVLSDVNVLSSHEYASLWESPSSTTEQFAAKVRSFRRLVLLPKENAELPFSSTQGGKLASSLVLFCMSPLAEARQRVEDWYSVCYVPGLPQLGTCTEASLWTMADDSMWCGLASFEDSSDLLREKYPRFVAVTGRWRNWLDCAAMEETLYKRIT